MGIKRLEILLKFQPVVPMLSRYLRFLGKAEQKYAGHQERYGMWPERLVGRVRAGYSGLVEWVDN